MTENNDNGCLMMKYKAFFLFQEENAALSGTRCHDVMKGYSSFTQVKSIGAWLPVATKGLNRLADSPTMQTIFTEQKASLMKNPFETFLMPMGILLLGFFSALLLPIPSFGVELSKTLMHMFHFEDLNQFYTVILCLWFLLLGTVEFFIFRFIYRRFIRV